MKNKTFISRMLVFTLALILTFTLIPPNLIAFAGAGGGAGGGFGGGGGTTAVNDNPINDEDIGLRFSLVSKNSSGETKVIPNIYGKYYLDVWDSAYFKESWYGAINSYGRYSPNPTDENIKRWSDATFDKTIGALISASGKGHVDMNIANHLNPGGASKNTFFTEGEGGLKINGDLFYNWFMEEIGTYDGEVQSRYFFFINAIYYGKTHGINMNNTFLVVEPVLHIANPDKNYQCLGTEYIASWYGYVEGNLVGNHREPGNAWTIRDRFSSLANNFQIKRTNYLDTEMEAAMKNVLGVSVPGQFMITGGSAIAYGDGSYMNAIPAKKYHFSYRTQGYAMQIFWLKDMETGTPIDTFDIETNKPNVPYYPENPEDTPDVPNSGTKNIIKLYADLYRDPTTGYYTEIKDIKNGDSYSFVRTNTSNLVTITDEQPINGYKVSGWYLSNKNYPEASSEDNAMLKASNMISTSNIAETDGIVDLSQLGGSQLRINQYEAAYKDGIGYNADGGQKYFTGLASPHGANGNGLGVQQTTGASQYYGYKRLEVSGTSNYSNGQGYKYPVNEDANLTVSLGDANTIVILYTREMTHITTDSSDTDITIPDNPDDRIDQSGDLTIVKLYGVLNPSTYEIENEKSVVLKNTTRNVNIKNESGYNFAEWVYTTGGSSTSLTASDMGNPSYYDYDGSADQAYRLDGFVDGFKNNASLSQYFKFNGSFPSIDIIAPDGYTSEQVAGRYSIGSRSGIGTRAYNSTIFFGGDGSLADNTTDDKDTNDVLYLLFLKTDQLTYAADDLVIPESYLTRYDNYKQNPMKVNSSISGSSYTEYLQKHKFKYVLPVVTASEYKELNPLFIPHIALKNKTQDGLLLNGATSVQRIDADNTIFKAFTNNYNEGISDYAQLVYIDHGNLITSSDSKTKIGNLLNVSALNLEYTAYRTGDRVTAAMWRHNLTNSISKAQGNSSKLLVTDTDNLIGDFTANNMNTKFSPIDAVIEESSATPSTSRQPNNSTQNFKLDFSFGEVGDGVKSIHLVSNKVNQINSTVNFNGIEQPRTADTPYGKVQLFKGVNSFMSLRYQNSDTKILGRAECAPLSGDSSTYEIHSLRRLYEIKQSDGTWKTAIGNTKYLNAASDVTITQNVQYKVHYGSSLANSYKDSVTTNNGTDKDRGQYGFVKSMKATNTISFYPYYTMQYELPSAYNGNLGKNGEVVHIGYSNNANQIYVIGEEKRYLNTYDYAEVSFYGHSVSSSKGTDVVNNVLNTTRNGRIEISSEQWSTHARANSLIGLDNCALPGGATLSITIPTNNRQTVHITSYSAYLPKGSAGYAQVNSQNDPSAFGSMPTNINDAAARHTKLVESVAAGFEGLNVEQYFTKNTSTEAYTNTKDNGNTYDKNNTVYNQISSDLGSNKNLYDLPNAYSVTDFSGKEDKYYYRPDGDVQFDTNKKPSAIKFNNYTLATGNNKDGDGNTGDFDTNYESSSPNANTKTTYYTFYMNRVGQVLCITSNTDSSAAMANFTGTPSGDGSVLVAEWSKTEPKHFTYTAGLSTDIKLAAENTGIVEELYKQLQEGTGSDKATPWSKADGQWYFEAFDGLTIAKFDTTLSVGFIDPYERTSVLDPEIIPNMANKGDILTSSVMSQIVTSNTSLMYGTANKIGEFCDTDGSKLGDIIMPDLRSFFISDIFFAPNITVQDLK